MPRILVTGDTHGFLGIKKILDIDYLDSGDFVIITGDAGILWNGSEEEKEIINQLTKKPFSVLMVDGNHDNFDMLNHYKTVSWCGGKVHKISKNIIHLMRGQVFNIAGRKIFTFGGADSVDKFKRIQGIDWWSEEMPSYSEMEEGLSNLSHSRNKVDYIITHTAPLKTVQELSLRRGFRANSDSLLKYLEEVDSITEYKHWFFGHFHIDCHLNNNKTVVFNRFIDI